jgi:hypothetical protein
VLLVAKGQENLIPMSERTKEEQKKIATMGGIRSGEVRREKATMKATLEMLLDEKYKNGKTYRELATLGLLKGAINGNAQNYKTILETLGELLQPEESKARVTIVNSLPKDDEDESNN